MLEIFVLIFLILKLKSNLIFGKLRICGWSLRLIEACDSNFRYGGGKWGRESLHRQRWYINSLGLYRSWTIPCSHVPHSLPTSHPSHLKILRWWQPSPFLKGSIRLPGLIEQQFKVDRFDPPTLTPYIAFLSFPPSVLLSSFFIPALTVKDHY